MCRDDLGVWRAMIKCGRSILRGRTEAAVLAWLQREARVLDESGRVADRERWEALPRFFSDRQWWNRM
jgi:hypothetical protein